jgi:hypothetical protein
VGEDTAAPKLRRPLRRWAGSLADPTRGPAHLRASAHRGACLRQGGGGGRGPGGVRAKFSGCLSAIMDHGALVSVTGWLPVNSECRRADSVWFDRTSAAMAGGLLVVRTPPPTGKPTEDCDHGGDDKRERRLQRRGRDGRKEGAAESAGRTATQGRRAAGKLHSHSLPAEHGKRCTTPLTQNQPKN